MVGCVKKITNYVRYYRASAPSLQASAVATRFLGTVYRRGIRLGNGLAAEWLVTGSPEVCYSKSAYQNDGGALSVKAGG